VLTQLYRQIYSATSIKLTEKARISIHQTLQSKLYKHILQRVYYVKTVDNTFSSKVILRFLFCHQHNFMDNVRMHVFPA